jgi:predicted phosphoribosyltransferase/dienelactone hydrolase
MNAAVAGKSHRTVRVAINDGFLEGDLVAPNGARGVVLFAHGSGSSRHSPRNRFVAESLRQGGLATLLIDLLTTEEEAVDRTDGRLRFDIGLLADRLLSAVDWLNRDAEVRHLKIGCFGASTGGGAALVAAAKLPDEIEAVVSRGGRPDLAGPFLAQVRAPTLLIVGGDDDVVLGLNETALAQLGRAEHRELAIIPGATHLFEEPGTLKQVAEKARSWFERYLTRRDEPVHGAHGETSETETPSPRRFADRHAAGRELAKQIAPHVEGQNVVVLGLPRGGVPVASEVALALGAPLDMFLVQKLGVPGQEELAMGAIASGGVRVLNEDVVGHLDLPAQVIEAATARAQRELARRELAYRGDRQFPQLEGKTVVLVDDGLATGSSMRAAIAAVRKHNPARVILAVPVASRSTFEELRDEVDDAVCVSTPDLFYAVSQWYDDFSQTSDKEVRELLQRPETAIRR